MQMHEKNIVLMNILRDIVENEADSDLCVNDEDDDAFWRRVNDRSVRRTEILAEIQHFLERENSSMRLRA